MCSKLPDLREALYICDYSIIILVETWLYADILDSEVSFNGYNTYRLDRGPKTSDKSRGGGVLIAVSSGLKSRKLAVSYDGTEQIFVEIRIRSKCIIVGGVYIPPNSSHDKYEQLCLSVQELAESIPDAEFAIFGDFNLPNAIWRNETFGVTVECAENSPALMLAETLCFLNLYEVIKVPNFRNVFLDLFFCFSPDTEAGQAKDILLPESLHHRAYCLRVGLSFDVSEFDELYLDFRNADYPAINDFLISHDWEKCLSGLSLDGAVDRFYESLYYCIDCFVPVRRAKNSSFPRWFTPLLKDLICKKKAAHKKYMSTRVYDDYVVFAHFRSLCKVEARKCHKAHLSRVEDSLIDNPRYFWKFVNSKRNAVGLPSDMHLNGIRAHSSDDIVNLFAEHFSSVYVNSNCQVPDFGQHCFSDILLRNISLSEIFSKIEELPDKTKCGPDNIPNLFIKQCIYSITVPLQIIFNKSLDSCAFPSRWKHSFISPIFKSGDREDISNYRAVCMQSAMPKLFDSLVCDQLSWSCRGMINPYQFGFCPGKSTAENLALYEVALLEALERGDQVDVIYTDFSRAFDRVNFKILLSKLFSLGFSEQLIAWLGSFLLGRTQAVKISGSLSSVIHVTSGVPQGSHCAPLLFILFVNELLSALHRSTGLMFADDLKIYRRVGSVEDVVALQGDLDLVWQWSQSNHLFLNVSKCFTISFYRAKHRIPSSYSINGVQLPYRSSAKDLGVIFDEKLTFIEHISAISQKGLSMLGFVLRNCGQFSVTVLRVLYCALVRANLEYATVIWSPFYELHKGTIERVQNKFLRFSAFKCNGTLANYHRTDMLRTLGLHTLERRRFLFDACFIFKLVNGITDCPQLLARINFNIPKGNLRHYNLFYIPFHRTDYGMHSPIHRALRTWNSLDGQLDMFNCSLSRFRTQLLKAL